MFTSLLDVFAQRIRMEIDFQFSARGRLLCIGILCHTLWRCFDVHCSLGCLILGCVGLSMLLATRYHSLCCLSSWCLHSNAGLQIRLNFLDATYPLGWLALQNAPLPPGQGRFLDNLCCGREAWQRVRITVILERGSHFVTSNSVGCCRFRPSDVEQEAPPSSFLKVKWIP